MILDIFYEETAEIVVSYHPVWELFFSMHVLSNPEHHLSRKKWARENEAHFPDLIKQIRSLGDLTNYWTLIIDSDKWHEIRQMEIVEMLTFFRKMNIYQWNNWIKYSGKTMGREERDHILEVTRQYYDSIFQKEELFLRVYLKRILRKEQEKCQTNGLWNWCKKIHPRLIIEQDAIIYRKNREYRFEKEKITTIYLTASTFVSPHLWLYYSQNSLEIVKGIWLEQTGNEIPEDLTEIFRALGDKTRLQIIRLLFRGICTTKELAQEMQLSEAAISKHLSVLKNAGLVEKKREGLYMNYTFKTERIDFIPYTFYETLMQ